MAELLVFDRAHNGFEPGDIIMIQGDGVPWGREEDIDVWVSAGNNPADFPNPQLAIFEIPGYPVDENLLEPWAERAVGVAPRWTLTKRKLWRVDIGALNPAEAANVGNPGGRHRSNTARARQLIARKDTGAALPDRASGGQQTRRYPGTAS
jgi:hypothetical protein